MHEPEHQTKESGQFPERFKYLINDPQARYKIREEFYKKYGQDTNIFSKLWKLLLKWITRNEGFGISELDFMKWEIRRGVLNPLDHSEAKGSRWWRDVNLQFIIISQTAAEIHEGKLPGHTVNNEIQMWLDYFKKRTGKAWYRAHNASIVKAYLNCREQALEESKYEQVFMNEVLYRLLYAQAMEEDDSLFGEFGVLGSNPMTPAVDIMVKIPAFYPESYPMNQEEIKFVLHKGHGIEGVFEKTFDEFLILEHIQSLYKLASKWTNIPALRRLLKSKKPIYPHNL